MKNFKTKFFGLFFMLFLFLSFTTSGSFNLVLKDDAGTAVLNKTLTVNSGGNSADGTTVEGVPGVWTATVTLTNFNGTGDYSFL